MKLLQWKRAAALQRENERKWTVGQCSTCQQHDPSSEVLQRSSTKELRSCNSAKYKSTVFPGRELRLVGKQSHHRNAHDRVDCPEASLQCNARVTFLALFPHFWGLDPTLESSNNSSDDIRTEANRSEVRQFYRSYSAPGF